MTFMLLMWMIVLSILFLCGFNGAWDDVLPNMAETENFEDNLILLDSDPHIEEDQQDMDNDNIDLDLGTTNDAETQQKLISASGWWTDTINCEKNSAPNIYCKPKNKWIWPY